MLLLPQVSFTLHITRSFILSIPSLNLTNLSYFLKISPLPYATGWKSTRVCYLPQVLCITWNILTISRLLFGPRQNRKRTVGIWRFRLTDSGFFLGIFSVAFLPQQEGYNVPREQVAVIQHQHKQHHHHFSLAYTFSMFCCGVILIIIIIIIILICNIITSFVSLFYTEFQIEMFARTVLVPSQLCRFSFSVSLNGFMLTHFSAFFLSPCVCVILRFFS